MMDARAFLNFCQHDVAMNDYRPATRFFLLAFVVVAVAGCGTHSRFASQLATPKGTWTIGMVPPGEAFRWVS